MWLYEVDDQGLREGFEVVLKPGRAGVQLGFDAETKTPQYLPIGNSIAWVLKHPDDKDVPFRLYRAQLECKTAGLCLVKQSEESANAERRAMVLVDGNTDPELGITIIEQAHGRPMPQLETYVQDCTTTRRLYVFNEGDGLFVHWSARSLGEHKPRRFVITWDGQHLRAQKKASRPPYLRNRSGSAPREEQAASSVQTPLSLQV